MFPDLPEHLQSLNTVSDSPPSAALNPDFESNFFDYILAGDLFGGNTDLSHAPYDDKRVEITPKAAETPATQPTPSSNSTTSPPSDLKSFIAQFASDHAPSFAGHAFPLPLPLPFDAQSAAPTPAGVNTAEIMPQASGSWETSPSSEEARISGAKRLKQVGAAPAEIEEDSKRRRNTEASARFRAKKKEREQTLERRAKDLEAQVARLTADKASLENENRLLKTIVLGASNSHSGPDALQLQATLAQLGAAGAKRKRD